MNALQQFDFDLLSEAESLIGVDEAGRGALAGPVVAGACLLSRALFESEEAIELSRAINDSKQLKAADRECQLDIILSLKAKGLLDFEVGAGTVAEIAELNILGATRLAMQRALEGLVARAKDWELPLLAADGPLFQTTGGVKLIVDGRPLKPFPYVHQGVVKGDGKSLAIATASIAAKVTRDRAMVALSKQYPLYGFGGHKGYGTTAHRDALLAHGPSAEHRALFLRKVLLRA